MFLAPFLRARQIDLDRLDLVVYARRYQNELPKKIKSRGKDAHLNHEELVQTMKWKQIVSPPPFNLVCALRRASVALPNPKKTYHEY